MCVGRTGADWFLIDNKLHFKHTDFDLPGAAERRWRSDYPFVEEFVEKNVLQAPMEARMFEVIDHLEANQASVSTRP